MINGTPALQFRDVVQRFSQVQSSVPEDIGRLCSLFQIHELLSIRYVTVPRGLAD